MGKPIGSNPARLQRAYLPMSGIELCEKNFTEFLSDLKKWSAFFYLPPKYGGQASKASLEFGEDVKKKLCFLSEERLTPREVKPCGDLRHFFAKKWRREGDSNSRGLAPRRFSRPLP